MNDDEVLGRIAPGGEDIGSYTREEQAAAELVDLRQMHPRHVLSSVKERRPEALVTILREWLRNGDEENAWQLCERLVVGIEPVVRSRLAAYRWIDWDTREDILHDLAVRLYDEWMSSDRRHAFWEVRFWHCLRLRIIDVLRTRRPNETAAGFTASGPSNVPDASVSPQEWAVAMLSLSRLPEQTRRVFVMKYYEGWTEDEIAAMMGVTSRTIRNWIRRGHEIMSEPASEDAR